MLLIPGECYKISSLLFAYMRLCVVFIQCHSVSIPRYKCLLCMNLCSVKHSTESTDSAFLHHHMQDLSGTGVCGGTNNTINQCSTLKALSLQLSLFSGLFLLHYSQYLHMGLHWNPIDSHFFTSNLCCPHPLSESRASSEVIRSESRKGTNMLHNIDTTGIDSAGCILVKTLFLFSLWFYSLYSYLVNNN